MENKIQILVNFIIRVILGIGIIFFANQFLEGKGMAISVGINAISALAAGFLGLPGVAMLYAVVAMSFL